MLPSGHQETTDVHPYFLMLSRQRINMLTVFFTCWKIWLRKVGESCSALSLTREIWGTQSKERSILHYRIWKVNCKLKEKKWNLSWDLCASISLTQVISHSGQRHYWWQSAHKLLLTLNNFDVLPFTFKQKGKDQNDSVCERTQLLKKNGKSISILQKNLPQSFQLLLGHWEVGQQTPAYHWQISNWSFTASEQLCWKCRNSLKAVTIPLFSTMWCCTLMD